MAFALTAFTNRLGRLADRLLAGRMGYDALEDKGRRKSPRQLLRSEDEELTSEKRGQAITLGRDIRRNYSTAAWAIRKHLDYVSTFAFQSKTGDKSLDQAVEAFVKRWGRPAQFDVASRHGLRRWARLCEAHRTVDGDVFTMLLASGQIQAIEGDRVRTPTSWPSSLQANPEWLARTKHGVVLGSAGQALSYCVNKRGREGLGLPDQISAANAWTFERLVPAGDMIHLAYFDRFDQIRGIAPIMAALNAFRDTYEGFDYALAKAKVSQLFAMVVTREGLAKLGVTAEDEEDEDQLKVDFSRGPVFLDMEPGSDAKFLESNQPSSEWQAFMNLVIACSLKSLDIPFSFYDESHTNYSGSRGAWLQYDQSAETKRHDLREALDHLTAWRIAMAVLRGEIVLPRGFKADRLAWDWIAQRVPWIDPLKEIQAEEHAVASGFSSTVGVCRRMGQDAYEIAQEQADYLKFRDSLGLPPPGQVAPVPIAESTEQPARKAA